MTNLMVARYDKNNFIFSHLENVVRNGGREAILIPTSDYRNVSKCGIDILGGRDKQVQRTGAHCFRGVNQPHHFDTC